MSSSVYSRKTSVIILTLVAGSMGGGLIPHARANGFFDDSSLTGSIYYWQRQRDRKDLQTDSDHYNQYAENLHHATVNGSLDFISGYAADMVGIDLAGFGALEMSNSGPAAPNEIGFSDARSRWDEQWRGDKSGVSLYKAALKVKHYGVWMRGGYIQPSGQTLIAPHWSFLPGTYRGIEAGLIKKDDQLGSFSLSGMWTDEYKAPWYQNMYNFRKADGKSGISYLYSVGAKYEMKNNLVLEGAYGQAADYMNQYFTKASYTLLRHGRQLQTSYQFYGAKDKEQGGINNVNSVYNGLAWLQAVTLGYVTGPFDFRLEGTWVKAEGNQGFFLQRMTPGYASSNGRIDIWWDARSDWNANGEKAIFTGVMYDLQSWDLPGWRVGASYVFGWDARPSSNPIYDQNTRLKESAWNLDLVYAVQSGRAKGTLFKFHYTQYDNHSNIPSYGGGYGNIFQDEKDMKFMVIAPFTIF